MALVHNHRRPYGFLADAGARLEGDGRRERLVAAEKWREAVKMKRLSGLGNCLA